MVNINNTIQPIKLRKKSKEIVILSNPQVVKKEKETQMTTQFLLGSKKLEQSFQAVLEERPLQDSHWKARMGTRVGVIVASALGGIPFIPVSLPLGKVLGPICAAGNFITFFAVNHWSVKGMIDTAFGAKTEEEIELTQEKTKRWSCKNVTLLSSAVLIAFLSQGSNTVAAIEYNAPQFKVVAGLILLISGAFLPVRSLQLSLEECVRRVQNAEAAQVRKIKDRMIDLLDRSHREFINKNTQEKCAFIQECGGISALLTEESTPVPTLINRGFNYTGIGIGAILTTLFGYASIDYTFTQTKQEIWNNSVFAALFATFAVASTAHLIGLSIIKTSQKIFNVGANILTGHEARNLSWQLRPKLSAALTLLGGMLNGAAVGASYIIWNDFYKKNAIEQGVFQNSLCIAMFLFFFPSSLDLVDETVAVSLAKGTAEEQKILKMSEKFEQLKTLIRRCPDAELMSYLETSGNVPRPFSRILESVV